MMERVREYHENPEHKLVDGVFTAQEVVWLLTPTKLRAAQYRPDIVTRVNECLQPEHLFDRDYEPTKIQRKACRQLANIVRNLGMAQSEDNIEGIDDAPTAGEEDEGSVSTTPQLNMVATSDTVVAAGAVATPQVHSMRSADEDGVIA